MNPRVVYGVSALLLLVASPGLAQGGRGGGRAGAPPKVGGAALPNRGAGDNRGPSNRTGRGDRSPARRSDPRKDAPRSQRHRDRNGDGRPDRHRPPRPRIWWPFFGGYGLSPLGYRSPFYDPFYSGFYNYEAFGRETVGEKNVTVHVKPESAQVSVNGLLYSSRGKTAFDLPTGAWTVELSAPGYRTEIISLNVEQGVRYRIERKLERDATRDPRGRPLKQEELPAR